MNWDAVWAVFVGVVILGFGWLEVSSLVVSHGKANTLSSKLRRWLGIEPQEPRRWWLGSGFLLFLAWFGIHILTPWL